MAAHGVLDQLYAEHRDTLYRYLAKVLGSGPPEPEDIVQASFERIAARTDLSEIDDPAAFLRRTARNLISDELRKKAVAAKHEPAIEGLYSEAKSDALGPERVYLGRSELSAVVDALRSMRKKRRDVLLGTRIDGLSVAEVARNMGLARSTASKHLARALEELDSAMHDPSGDRSTRD